MSEQQFKQLSPTEHLAWLRLIRSDNVGPITFFRLLERFGSASNALSALPDIARKGGKRHYKIASEADGNAEIERTLKVGARLVAWCEPEYPPLLRMAEGSPPILSMMGNIHLTQNTCVGIVGARNASVNGLNLARRLASDLGRGGG